MTGAPNPDRHRAPMASWPCKPQTTATWGVGLGRPVRSLHGHVATKNRQVAGVGGLGAYLLGGMSCDMARKGQVHMRAIGYVRLSKADQRDVDNRLSLTAQREAIVRAVDYEGWSLEGFYEDNGKTGANTRREGFQSALAALKRHEADMLIVARLDRLSRDVGDFGKLVKDAERQGWFISVLDQKVDTSTAAGWFAATMLAAVGEYERRLISERTKAALSILKSRGTQLGRPSDFPEDVTGRMLDLAAQSYSASAIARQLNAEGVPTARGGAWHHSVVSGFLRRSA